MTAGARQTPGPEQPRAVEQLRTLAQPYRFRVRADVEGFRVIPGRSGQIESFCNGVNCHSCAFQDQFVLAVYTDRPSLFEKLWAVPGVNGIRRATESCARSSRPRPLSRWPRRSESGYRRTQTSSRSLQKLRLRVPSRPKVVADPGYCNRSDSRVDPALVTSRSAMMRRAPRSRCPWTHSRSTSVIQDITPWLGHHNPARGLTCGSLDVREGRRNSPKWNSEQRSSDWTVKHRRRGGFKDTPAPSLGS